MGSTSAQRRQAGVFVVILLGASLLGPACRPHSRDTSPRTRAPDRAADLVLRVGTSGDYDPFSLWPTDVPEPQGFSIEVARAFARSSQRRIDWIRFSWPELEADLTARRFDLALSGITVRPDRSLAGRFSVPLTTASAVALVRAGSGLSTRRDLDRPAVQIAVNRGGHLERVARLLFPKARIEAVTENERVPDWLADGRADAILTDDLEARHWRSRLPPSRPIGPLTRDHKAAWFPIGHESLAREFDRWLLEAEATGELARLRLQSGLAEARTALPLPALLAHLDERLALMPAVARAKRVLARPIADRAQEARVHEAAQRAALDAASELSSAPPPPPLLRRLVEAQIAAARFVQERAIREEEVEPSRASSDGPTDETPRVRTDAAQVELDERLRPAVAFLTERIVWLAVASYGAVGPGASVGARPPLERAVVAEALEAHALPAPLIAEIHAALEALVTTSPRARKDASASPARAARPGRSPSA